LIAAGPAFAGSPVPASATVSAAPILADRIELEAARVGIGHDDRMRLARRPIAMNRVRV